jgi:putative ABC transport system ATP-binding protein
LRGVDLTIQAGEMVAVVGPSGSGKTTILNLITGIDRATSGSVVVDGADLAAMSEERLARWRGRTVGIVFQFFQLLPTMTAIENAALPMDFARQWKPRERWLRARQHLDSVGLGDKSDHLPVELSGGEQQRVAIARALACEPKLLVGDEPTGNLDTETGSHMMDLLERVNDAGTTVLFVTHDLSLAARAQRIVTIRDGRVVADESRSP